MNRPLLEAGRIYRCGAARNITTWLGRRLYRSTPYSTALAGAVIYMLKKAGLEGITNLAAYGLPAAIGGGALIGGLALRYVPNLITFRHRSKAKGLDFRHNAQYRLAHLDEQIDFFWERMFRQEVDIRYDNADVDTESQMHQSCIPRIRQAIAGLGDRELAYLGVDRSRREEGIDALMERLLSANPQTDQLEKTYRAFKTSVQAAFGLPLNVEEQKKVVGFDISWWEEWLKLPYLFSGDNSLAEKWASDKTLADIRSDSGMDSALRQLPGSMWQAVWFMLLSREFEVNLGVQLSKWEKKYNRQMSVQYLLFPGIENAEWSEDLPELRAEIPGARADMFSRILFSRSYEAAREVLDRMYLHLVKEVTNVRAAYDPEYRSGAVGYSSVDDHKEIGISFKRLRKEERRMGDARSRIHGFLGYLKDNDPALWQDREGIRAAKIAFELDHRGLRQLFGLGRPYRDIRQPLYMAIADKAAYSHRLYAIRMMHTLCMLHMRGYRNYLKELAFSQAAPSQT